MHWRACASLSTVRLACAVPDLKMRMRRKAVRALASHTGNAVRDLRNDEDEMLRGAPPRCQRRPQCHICCRPSALVMPLLDQAQLAVCVSQLLLLQPCWKQCRSILGHALLGSEESKWPGSLKMLMSAP